MSALHSQIEIDDGVAGVARDDEPMMLRRKRSAYCRPEPRGFLRGQAGGELSDDSERVLVGFALPAHAFEVFMDFIVARVVAHALRSYAAPDSLPWSAPLSQERMLLKMRCALASLAGHTFAKYF